MSHTVVFSSPYRVPGEIALVEEALASGHTQGDGALSVVASQLLAPLVGGGSVLTTTSCTHALEMAALLLDLRPGDEVIVPSFTFVSTINAFVLRGAIPVFVDIRPDTFNVDERLVEAAVTSRTRAVVVVHYGGVACAMGELTSIAERHGLALVEDNAHGLGGSLDSRPLGSFAALATQSFHATKNVSCGEGGALVVNDPALLERAEVIREKGTNRRQFLRGAVDKYTWVDIGSSYLLSDVLAALLTAQLRAFDEIQRRRHAVWSAYDRELRSWMDEAGVRTQVVPAGCTHPAHLYALLLPDLRERTRFIDHCARLGVVAPFHYVPLHATQTARQHGRVAASCTVTEDVASRLVRLPLHAGMDDDDVAQVLSAVRDFRPQS